MRRILLIFVLVLVCAAAAAVLAPGATGRLRQALLPGDAPGKAAHQPLAVAVTTATAATADFPIRRYAIGFVSSPAVVEVNARVASQIVSIAVKDGQMVAAGDVLFKLDDRALQAAVDRDRATLAKDQAMLVSAQADLERARDLAADKTGTQQAYDQALAAEKAAAATVAADQAALDADQVQLGFATITAPIAGRLGVVNVAVGDLVGSGGNGGASGSVAGSGGSTAAPTPLVTITQMDPLQVAFSLPETELDLLRQGLASASPPKVTLHRGGDPKPLGSGTLDFIDSTVDTASGTIAVKATLPNPDLSLWPGQYADIVVDAGTMPALVSVPTVALQAGQAGPFVYVVKPDQTVAVRPVKVAVNQGEASGVSDGLTAGERVVVEGQVRLTEGTKVREQAASGAAPRGGGGTTVAEDEAGPAAQPAGAAKTP